MSIFQTDHRNAKQLKSYNLSADNSEFDLQLSRNEGAFVFDSTNTATNSITPETMRRYPEMSDLRNLMAKNYSVDPDRIVVTAGGDQAIELVFRLAAKQLDSATDDQVSRRFLTHHPGFEMFDVYAGNLQIELTKTKWFANEFPIDDFVSEIEKGLELVVLVSPNNPTGRVIELENIFRIAQESSKVGASVLVDLAYVEFARQADLSELYQIENVTIVRTMSKAWGLAGLRVGCAIAPDPETANQLKAIRGPYPVSGPSISIASNAMTNGRSKMAENVISVQANRVSLVNVLQKLGFESLDSEANFILARGTDKTSAKEIAARLAELKIGVRIFPDREELDNYFRITVPATTGEFQILINAIENIFDYFEPHQSPKHSTMLTNETFNRPMTTRIANYSRTTRETQIDVSVNLDGTGKAEISTGLGFLNHMLTALACHSRIDIEIQCNGDLEIDDHHTVEDCALALGSAFDAALGDRTGITRFASQCAPLDESLVRSVVDLSGRPVSEIHLGFDREFLGDVATENISHFFVSLAMTLKCALHVDLIRGENDHHKAEAAFKALALTLRQAVAVSECVNIPSTKGTLQ